MAVEILEQHYIFLLIDCVFNATAFDILIVINTGCQEYSFHHTEVMSMNRYLANNIENLNRCQKVHGIVMFNCSLHHPQHEIYINTFIYFQVTCCYQMMVKMK
jgi:hypothetical protein